VAPAATPPSVIARLNADTVKVVRSPEIQELIKNIGYEPTGSTPDELTRFMHSETAIWAKVIKNANIRLD